MENDQRGVYPHYFQPNRGIGETGLRQRPSRAPACLKRIYDALARRLQPFAKHAHAKFSFFRHVIEANSTVVPSFDFNLGGGGGAY